MFTDYYGSEDHFQETAIKFIQSNYPQFLTFHAANERKCSVIQGAKLKRKGVKKGMPDIMMISRNLNIAVELKTEGKKPSKDQLKILFDLKYKHGWQAFHVRGFDELEYVLEQTILLGNTPDVDDSFRVIIES